MSNKVSIIVPVYNAEEFLPRCIDSILKQTYVDWELLLIDDGSLDASGKVCDDYAKIDPRIRVYHKKNGGVSSARNFGIEKAEGEWISFVDADDALASNTLSVCSDFFSVADMIRFSMRFLYSPNMENSCDYELKEVSKDEYIYQLASRDTILGVCGGVYKKRLFVDNKLLFDTSLINGEDWIVLVLLSISSSTIKVINNPLYLYTKYNESSCTFSFKYPVALSSIKAYSMIEQIIIKTYGSRYRKALSKGKCNLVNDFVSHCQNKTMTKSEFIQFTKEGGDVSVEDIRFSCLSWLQKARLVFYSSKFGKYCLSRGLS